MWLPDWSLWNCWASHCGASEEMYGAPSQLGLLSLDLVFSHTRVSFWPAEMKAYHVRVCACLCMCVRERQNDQCKLCNSSLGVIFFFLLLSKHFADVLSPTYKQASSPPLWNWVHIPKHKRWSSSWLVISEPTCKHKEKNKGGKRVWKAPFSECEVI